MKFIFTALAFLLFLFNASAYDATSSIMCPAENTIKIEGINCCSLRISAEKCQELIETKLSLEDIERVKYVSRDIVSKIEKSKGTSIGAQPNCHWNAVATTLPGFFEAPIFLSPYPYLDILTNNYVQIERGELQAGDLIEFHEFSKQKEFTGDPANGKRWIWYEFDRAAHSLVYLGDGLIFQKENANNAAFSIDYLDETYKVYLKALNSKPHLLKGTIEIRYHRPL